MHAKVVDEFWTLATADPAGLPWASPVWYAAGSDLREFFWVSSPVARHSSNIAGRPQIGIVITFSQASQAQGGHAWTRADVEASARHRLYHATAIQHFVLSSADERLPVDIA